MEGGRQAPRELTLRTAKITTGLVDDPIACAILNESTTGLGLLVPKNTVISDNFALVIDPSGVVRECRLVWRRDCRLGVRFVDGTHAKNVSMRDAQR